MDNPMIEDYKAEGKQVCVKDRKRGLICSFENLKPLKSVPYPYK